jgi:transposase
MFHRAPRLKQRARSLARRQTALQLLAQGKSITAIAQELDVTGKTVRNLLTQALATDSLYPSSLTSDQIAQLRQIEAEILGASRAKAIEAHAAVAARIGTPQEKNMDATASARLLEAVVRAVEMESALFGTKQPLKIIEQSMRYQLTQVDARIDVHLDREQLRPKWPTPYGPREPICNGMREQITNGSTDGSGSCEQ